MTAKKKSQAKSQETTLRHLWLAGLGMIVVTRREAINAANDAAHKMEAFKQQAEQLACQAQTNIVEGIASMRKQGEAKVGQFNADMEARLAPVLTKLGLNPRSAAKPRVRKAAKKATAKRTRSTTARQTPTKRAVRKSRT